MKLIDTKITLKKTVRKAVDTGIVIQLQLDLAEDCAICGFTFVWVFVGPFQPDFAHLQTHEHICIALVTRFQVVHLSKWQRTPSIPLRSVFSDVLKGEAEAKKQASNPANFGPKKYCLRECICEVEGQVPCPGTTPLPKEMTGKYRTRMAASQD